MNDESQKPTAQIPICFTCDSNYAVPTAVAIQSIVASKKADTRYVITIVSDLLSEQEEARFGAFNSSTVEIHVLRKSSEDFLYLGNTLENTHFTPAVYLRFLLPKLFPQYDKLLYLDCDIIVRTDLSELFETDLADNLLGAVLDQGKVCRKDLGELFLKDGSTYHVERYFNSGVMLLNLRQMRAEGTTEKLIQARQNLAKKGLVDQDPFNIVADKRKVCLSGRYNSLCWHLRQRQDQWSLDAYNKLFDADYRTLDELYGSWKILHFAGVGKPWTTPLRVDADEWLAVYCALPAAFGLPDFSKERVVVSLTSYPARIGTVHLAIESLLNQTYKADCIVLYLADSEFPGKEKDLPEELLALCEKGLEIHWCEDLRSFTKLIPALREFPEDVIVTTDDDVIVDPDWLKDLVCNHWLYPNCVCAHRAHEMVFCAKNRTVPYNSWEFEVKPETLSFNHFFTGIGGVLYPPHCLSEDVFDKEKYMRICPHGDDIWFWAMAVKAGTKVRVTEGRFSIVNIDGTQESGLWQTVNAAGENDRAFERLFEAYPEIPELVNPAFSSEEEIVGLRGQVKSLRSRTRECAAQLKDLNPFIAGRVDVLFLGKSRARFLERVTDGMARITEANWLEKQGLGYVVESDKGEMTIRLRAQGDGEFVIWLRGVCVRDGAGNEKPYWIDFTSFTVNGAPVFEGTKSVWHNRPCQHRVAVKDGDEVTLGATWTPHMNDFAFTAKELQGQVKKLGAEKTVVEGKLKKVQEEKAAVEKNLRQTQAEKAEAEGEARKWREENEILRGTVSFKIGRFLTWVPRKVRGWARS